MKFMITTLCLVALATPACATEADDGAKNKKAVAEVVRTAVDGVLVVLTNPELSDAEKRKQVMSIIEPVVDFPLMAMLTLGKTQWRKLSKEQRASFTDLFVEDLKRSYFEKLTLFTDGSVEYEAPVEQSTKSKKKGSPKYSVPTYIISKGERVQVSFALALRTRPPAPAASGKEGRPTRGGAKENAVSEKKPIAREDETGERTWRVYDLVIEGISIRKGKRSDYRDFLRRENTTFDDLLADMRKKIDAAKAKQAKSDEKKSS